MTSSLQLKLRKVAFRAALSMGIVNGLYLVVILPLAIFSLAYGQRTGSVEMAEYYFAHNWLFLPGLFLTALSIAFIEKSKEVIIAAFFFFFGRDK